MRAVLILPLVGILLNLAEISVAVAKEGDRTGGGGMNYVELPGGQMMPLPFYLRVSASRNKAAPKPPATISVPVQNQEAGKPREIPEPSICRVNDGLTLEDFPGLQQPDPKVWRAHLNALLEKIFELSPLHAHQLFENAKKLTFRFAELPENVKIYTSKDDGYVELPQEKKQNCDYQVDGVVYQDQKCWIGNFTANAELNIKNPYVFMLHRAYHELWEPTYYQKTMRELDELLLEIFAYAGYFDLDDESKKRTHLSPSNALDRFLKALGQNETSLGSNENPMRFGRNFIAYGGKVTQISAPVSEKIYQVDRMKIILKESGIDLSKTKTDLDALQSMLGYSIGFYLEGNTVRVVFTNAARSTEFAATFEKFLASQNNELVFESNSRAVIFKVDVKSAQKALELLKTKPSMCKLEN